MEQLGAPPDLELCLGGPGDCSLSGEHKPVLAAIQTAAHQPSWSRLKEDVAHVRQSYVPPVAAWRFYRELPLIELLSGSAGETAVPDKWPYVDFSRAWYHAFRNLTQHHMLMTAIALKRYELRHLKLPSNLSTLCPEFLATVPLDLMDGQRLRYRLKSDNSYTLYSVGKDGEDNGGDASPDEQVHFAGSEWLAARDWVWPRLKH